MKIDVLTIFPKMIQAVFGYGVIGRAWGKKLLEINPINLRDFTKDKHRSVDARPFGGGPGMVMRVDVIDRAMSEIECPCRGATPGGHARGRAEGQRGRRISKAGCRRILLSPRGKVFSQAKARELSGLGHLVLISGRYEGVDERVRECLVDEEISIGDYILSGGEIPAMVVIDAVARLIPGVVGDPESLEHESFSLAALGWPQYTRPVDYRGWEVPEVLRSGNHAEIKKWREEQSRLKTLERGAALQPEGER